MKGTLYSFMAEMPIHKMLTMNRNTVQAPRITVIQQAKRWDLFYRMSFEIVPEHFNDKIHYWTLKHHVHQVTSVLVLRFMVKMAPAEESRAWKSF